jgi:GH25 family lysozyme M1 (1,4-beta-N-acetylmuramidase)
LNIFNFKTKHTPTFSKYAGNAAKTFLNNNLMKLTLRAKLIELSISWESCKLRVKQNEFNKEVELFRQNLREIEEIYEDKKNNLIGLTYFDILIKKIKK